MKRKIKHNFFARFYKLLPAILFLPALYYFSLSLECYFQRKCADKFEFQKIPFLKKHGSRYLFGKPLYFTPEIAAYQSSGGRLHLYLKDSVVTKREIQSIRIEVIRTNLEETKTYTFTYEDAEKAAERFRRMGFYSLAFPCVKLHIDYNDIQIGISGVKLRNPAEDADVLLTFSGIKRRVRLLTYLFKSFLALTGGLLIVFSCALIRRKVSKENKNSSNL